MLAPTHMPPAHTTGCLSCAYLGSACMPAWAEGCGAVPSQLSGKNLLIKHGGVGLGGVGGSALSIVGRRKRHNQLL